MWVFSKISCHIYVSRTVYILKEPYDPINHMNDGHNTDLVKVELNKGTGPVAYDKFLWYI